jgi:predicted ATPase/class 3 adenylate cyclase
MPDNVARWLEKLGLGQYADLFADNDIDEELLPELNDADLEKIGISSLGHRKKLLKAIAAFQPSGFTDAPALPQPSPIPPVPVASEAERRQLTVMFCDLVGSTALSTKLDPEDLRELITAFQDRCRQGIKQYQGFIARYMGDGMLVYFGYPQAHEDDAERAVRTALAIVRSMAELNAGIGARHDLMLAVRVGVATGPVVVGDIVGEGAAEEAAVVGETPNLAARLQGVAEPNHVVIASTTRRLLGALFEYDNLGTHELKGIAQPVPAWWVVCESDIDSRYEAKRVSGRLPLVGRQEEMGLLIRSWEAAKHGHGQVVLIQGEAGIGKSRLLEALREHVAGEDYLWAAVRCSPYHTNSTLYPVIERLKRAVGWKAEDGVEKKIEKLEASLQEQSLPLEEVMPLYAELLSLPLPEQRYEPLDLNPKQKREATLDALAGWLLDVAERAPVLHVWEDLHWADPTTLELLGLYIEQSPTVSMLNVLTYRPQFVPPWTMHSHMTPITLNRLERPEVEALIEHQAAGKSVPSEVIEHIVAKADGVPLYVEELTKTILESDYLGEEADRYTIAGSLSELAIPATLQDSLMARLDRLPTIREIAQLGSVLGREFGYQMLCFLTPHEESVVQDGLGQLVEDELLYQRGRPPRSKYIFKHALIQDAAYQSLLKRTRRQYHQQVARLLEDRFPETVVVHPELLAHHYQEAGMTKEAIDYWYLAGERARSRSANHEAIAHLGKGISLTSELPDEQEQAQCELKLQFSLGGAYLQMMGHSAPEVEAAFARARELCVRVGDAPEFVPTLFGLWRTYVVQMTDSEKPREVAAQLLRLAEEDGSTVSRVIAHYAVGFTAHVMGQFSDARGHLQEGIRLYSSDDRDTAAVYRFGQDPGVACRCYLALAEWALGYPDKALRYAQDGLALARRLDDPFSVAFSLVVTSFLDQSRGDQEATSEKAYKVVSLAEEKGYSYWLGFGKVMQGWGKAVDNPTDAVIQGFRDRIEQHRALGTDLFAPYFLTLLGDVALKANQADECITALNEAETILDRTGEQWWESETHRLQGVLSLAQDGDSTEAESNFEKALALARQRDAKSFELRAATSLARLWQQLGKVEEARKMLSETYSWFVEGFDTADLREAKKLLESLSSSTDVQVAQFVTSLDDHTTK